MSKIKQIPLLFILLMLDAFVLGGCVTLAVVNQFLANAMKRLTSIEAQSQTLNILDQLIPYYMAYGGLLLFLILISISVWVWATTKSWLRYAVPLLFILIFAGAFGWITISRSKASPILPRTPTPIPVPSANADSGKVGSNLNKPVPTPTAPTPPIPPTPSSKPAEISRKIPLRRSDSAITQNEGQLLYRLVEDKEVSGNVIADHLGEDEMMCVQHVNIPPTECICWVGPLENAGITGAGTRGMRRVIILEGSVEEAALAVAEDWNADLRAAGKKKICPAEHLVISYDGGLFKPEPSSN